MISDIKTSISSADKDGNVTCTLKFKVPCDSDEIDLWFWFCKQHRMTYNLMATDDMLCLTGRPGIELAPGQRTLDDHEPKDTDGSELEGCQ